MDNKIRFLQGEIDEWLDRGMPPYATQSQIMRYLQRSRPWVRKQLAQCPKRADDTYFYHHVLYVLYYNGDPPVSVKDYFELGKRAKKCG